MKLNQEQIKSIVFYKQSGYGSRWIAEQLGISKSAVNAAYNREVARTLTSGDILDFNAIEEAFEDFLDELKPEVKPAVNVKYRKPRILFFDLESTPSIVAAFGRWKQNIAPNAVIREGGYLLSAAWKWLGEHEVHSKVLTPDQAIDGDDLAIVCQLYDAFEQADLIVAHNGDKFDLPLFKTRLLANGLPAPKRVRTVDTLKIAKQLKFNSNKLDSLGNYLSSGRKIETTGMSLWLRCMDGDEQALAEMQEYNVQDVYLLEQVYMQLRAFDSRAPNLGVYYDDGDIHCPVCGSTHIESTGNTVVTNLSVFLELECKECGNKSRTRQAVNSKEHRSLQLQS